MKNFVSLLAGAYNFARDLQQMILSFKRNMPFLVFLMHFSSTKFEDLNVRRQKLSF